MSGTLITAVTATSAVCAGVAGGVYFAFSALLLPALRALPAIQAVPAMQRININAVRLPLMVVFFGGATAALAVVITELASGAATPAAPNRIVGAELALAAFGITIVRNVPLNDTLAQITPDGPDIEARWNEFGRAWGVANHVRATAAIAATITLLDSLARST
ncbi:hypothetical protein BJG92_02952 [Arthrobacter sp. SO5]|uniref:anthrone oxygenase family protein n=1 Tax=Arthrobacter sp. SO5 TaxID=1897055 RepID=UPI001E59DC0D|nr:anthrone oxygenase family protein [Arthrobacter sp. SO5]MCB5275404.1 hypothetical protein [Arthrobacter sp. SO5]